MLHAYHGATRLLEFGKMSMLHAFSGHKSRSIIHDKRFQNKLIEKRRNVTKYDVLRRNATIFDEM